VLGVPSARVHRIRNAVEVPEETPDPGPWRRRLGIAPDVPVVTMLANLERPKDHETLVRAWLRVRDASPTPPLLVLAGRRGATASKVARLVGDLGLEEAVRLTGTVDDVDGLFAATDLAVHAAHVEGVPNAVLEAMARARAVVATDLPGTREALGDDEDLVPAGDADALAARILHHLASPEARAARGERNRGYVLDHFERTRSLAKTTALLASALEA
jgi:glycosyltransferase involved in cell wall biosynthesis